MVTVHDMTYERFPELFGTEDPVISQKKETITRADKIIAISEKTKADIIDIYGLSGSNMPKRWRDCLKSISCMLVRDFTTRISTAFLRHLQWCINGIRR